MYLNYMHFGHSVIFWRHLNSRVFGTAVPLCSRSKQNMRKLLEPMNQQIRKFRVSCFTRVGYAGVPLSSWARIRSKNIMDHMMVLVKARRKFFLTRGSPNFPDTVHICGHDFLGVFHGLLTGRTEPATHGTC